MIAFPHLDPVIVQIGPLGIRWYGMMYTLAFILGWPLLKYRAKRHLPHLDRDMLGDLVVWILAGVILGGRLGYVLFYQYAHVRADPWVILRVWEGGMSFHGGLVGVLFLCYVFSRRRNISCLTLADMAIPIFPLGLFLGRIGNFINGELWGRTTDLPWGMVFPGAGSLPRHPSQLYEAALEGVVLFVILWWLGRRERPRGFMLGAFLAFYALFRFLVEFVREPDVQLGYLSFGLTMGQWLTLPMAIIGVGMMLLAVLQPATESEAAPSASETEPPA
ncbi:MAG: prolipoprotein diacylglyceryl transferase [Magnetococcales bacterium]|nr:prolipoprotein diacylglyceryl transferase [Magnetococcales bacterium]MBF0322120.1 prolipoprotein diacylglyceryl transferase [Magnetococcales bacterium]